MADPSNPLVQLCNSIDVLDIPTVNIYLCHKFHSSTFYVNSNTCYEFLHLIKDIPINLRLSIIPNIFKEFASKHDQWSMYYTDGSVQDGGTSYFFFNSELFQESGKLPQPSLIFFAETVAILRAIVHIKQHHRPGRFIVANDSLSALNKALDSSRICTKTLNIVAETKVCLSSMAGEGFTVKLVWIPAHCNIPGNNKADSLAKIAALEGELSDINLEYKNFLSVHRTACVSSWQERWRNRNLGRFCFSILKKVSTSPWFQKYSELDRFSISILNRIISNQTRLNGRLSRINIVASPLCDECLTYETPDHVIWSCRKYDRWRPELLRSLREANRVDFSENVRDTIAVALESSIANTLVALTSFFRKSNLRI